MPTYEMTVIMRKLAKPALVSAVKRVAEEIYVGGGYIRKIESLGTRQLPNIKLSKKLRHTEGTYMLMVKAVIRAMAAFVESMWTLGGWL